MADDEPLYDAPADSPAELVEAQAWVRMPYTVAVIKAIRSQRSSSLGTLINNYTAMSVEERGVQVGFVRAFDVLLKVFETGEMMAMPAVARAKRKP